MVHNNNIVRITNPNYPSAKSNSMLHCNQSEILLKHEESENIGLGTGLDQDAVQVSPDSRSVLLGKTMSDGLFHIHDPPVEAVPVADHLLPGSFAAGLAGERPGVHDMDVDDRGETHLQHHRKHQLGNNISVL